MLGHAMGLLCGVTAGLLAGAPNADAQPPAVDPGAAPQCHVDIENNSLEVSLLEPGCVALAPADLLRGPGPVSEIAEVLGLASLGPR